MLLENFMTVTGQAISLFLMMGIGVLLYKTKLFRKESITDITNILLWGITPCLIINTFTREFDRGLAVSLGIFAAAAAGAMLLTALAALIIFKKRPAEEKSIMSFAITFSNCGFMGLPLAQALYGAKGVMYASIFVAVFNVVQWTVGFVIMSGREKKIQLRRILINPGVIGVVLGLPLFLFSVTLPHALGSVISSMAEVNTPLAMIVIGGHLAAGNVLLALRDKRVLAVSALRLLVVPAFFLAVLWGVSAAANGFGWSWTPDRTALSTLLIELAAPCGATTVLIGTLCGRDGELSGRCVALSTLFSIVTLPVMATLCELLL